MESRDRDTTNERLAMEINSEHNSDDASSAKYVKRSRAKLRLTQAELADKLGLERRTIMRFEKGRHELPKHVRLAIRYLLKSYKETHRRENGDDE